MIESGRVPLGVTSRTDFEASSLGLAAFAHCAHEHPGEFGRLGIVAGMVQAWLGLAVVLGPEWERLASELQRPTGDDVVMARARLRFSVLQCVMQGGPGGWRDVRGTAAPALAARAYPDDWVTSGWSRAAGMWLELGAAAAVTAVPPALAPELGVHEVAAFLNQLERAIASRAKEETVVLSPAANCKLCGPSRLSLQNENTRLLQQIDDLKGAQARGWSQAPD